MAQERPQETIMSEIGTSDLERRFGGVARLYGEATFQRFQQAHVVVAGLGGVGSWAAEALIRSGISTISLIDMDHIAPSNTNRQLHALDGAFGQSKVDAMAERLLKINPQLKIIQHDLFLEPDNLSGLIPTNSFVLDATDAILTKIALAVFCVKNQIGLVMCGAAGGKIDPRAIYSDDLAKTVQDPLLAKIRADLRKNHSFSKDLKKKMGIRAVFSSEPRQGKAFGGLACSGYGSAVTVTASFGFVAAAEILGLAGGVNP